MKYILIILVALIGCKATKTTYKKVATDTDVTLLKKAIIAPWVQANFPNQTEFIAGRPDTLTEVIYADDEVMGELNDIIDSLLMLPKDSVLKIMKKKCNPIVKTVTIHRVDTFQVDNGATIFNLQRQKALAEAEAIKAIEDKKQMGENVVKYKRQRNIFFGILLCLTIIIGLSIYYKMRL